MFQLCLFIIHFHAKYFVLASLLHQTSFKWLVTVKEKSKIQHNTIKKQQQPNLWQWDECQVVIGKDSLLQRVSYHQDAM